jgi:hypothetical protein
MGLDVTAYSKLVFVTSDTTEGLALLDENEWHTYVHLYPAPGFEARFDGQPAGYYRVEGELFHFWTPYSSYYRWRAWLSEQAQHQAPAATWTSRAPCQGQPFYELVHFSDCEGTLGPATSKKLADDFQQWAEALASGDSSGLYQRFQKAFALASRGGVVVFD